MARILWIPSFQPGSYFPAVPIAEALRTRGHEVTVLCEAPSENAFTGLGFRFIPARRLDAFNASGLRLTHRAAKLAWHEGYVRALFADAMEALTEARYDAVMTDPLEPGAEFAAEAAGVVSFSYVHWALDESGADVPFQFHFWDRETPAPEAFVAWWNAQRALVGLAPDPRPIAEHRWYRTSPHLTLRLGVPELVEPKGEPPPYVVRTGPCVYGPAAEAASPDWLADLGRDRPAVLASVSTVGRTDAQLIEAMAAAVDGENLDVVITAPAGDQLTGLPANVRPAPFVPHDALLSRVSVVASHAGLGTVTRAACAGVPQLLFPAGRDQFEAARGACAAGVALSLDRERLEPAQTRTALRALIDDAGYRARAAEVAKAARSYDAPRTAAEAVERLLASAEKASTSSLA